MHIILVGLNHETAPVQLREKLAFRTENLDDALNTLIQNGNEITEAIILSTCNRVEIYAVARDEVEGVETVKNFMSDFHGLPLERFEPYLLDLTDSEVVRHLFEVSSSLKSMVLGETQIQAQIKQAYEFAKEHNTTGPILSNLFQSALSVGKKVRNETAISEHSLSISHAAVGLLKREFSDLSDKRILVVGNGKMGILAIKALLKNCVRDVTIVNRTESSAHKIAGELNLKACGFDKLEECLIESDIVICSTGAPHVVLTKEFIRKVEVQRNNKPLFIVDIAVPRDVEDEVGELESVTLINIDSLKSGIESNLEKRTSEINKVREIIRIEVVCFENWLESLKVKPVITGLRSFAEDIREKELQRALRKFEKDLTENETQIIHDLTRRIVNKMLHQPISRLREYASDDVGPEYSSTVMSLFGLENKEITSQI